MCGALTTYRNSLKVMWETFKRCHSNALTVIARRYGGYNCND